MISEITKNEHLLFRTSKLPMVKKKAIWDTIVAKVNSVGTVRRESRDLQKRWYDYKRRTKAKLASNLRAARKTGGGRPDEMEVLDPLEQQVASTIPVEMVTGVEGLDSHELEDFETFMGKC